MAVNYGNLPFAEQIEFFRRKLNLPSESWTQLFQEGHDHGFVVAGANRDDLVADFRAAVDKAISQGTTLEEFRRDFDRIVATHGWSYNGGRGWRSRVIYDTNLRTSYAAGRYHQLQAVKARRPYWRYRHSIGVQDPRPQHLAWDGLILRHDDPWLQTHYPPNGWGCRCYIESLAERDLKRLGKNGPDTAPPIVYETRTIGTQGPAPRTVQVPDGIDPGFAYAPGATAWGKSLSEAALAVGEIPAGDWTRLITTGWADYGRPEKVPLAAVPKLGKRLTDMPAMTEALKRLIGGDEQFYRPGGVPVTVVAETLAGHIPLERSEYLPLLIDTLMEPYEVWASLERKDAYYELRVRALKAYKLPGRGGSAVVIADGGHGFMQGWTFVPVSQLNYLQKQRMGVLIYGQ